MNISIYVDGLAVEILPAYCNWTLINKVKFDQTKNTFVEFYLPNHEIGIMHLAGKTSDHLRYNKEFLSEIETQLLIHLSRLSLSSSVIIEKISPMHG